MVPAHRKYLPRISYSIIIHRSIVLYFIENIFHTQALFSSHPIQERAYSVQSRDITVTDFVSAACSYLPWTWWCHVHVIQTLSALLSLCEEVTGGFPTQRVLNRALLFCSILSKQLSNKRSSCRWFETQLRLCVVKYETRYKMQTRIYNFLQIVPPRFPSYTVQYPGDSLWAGEDNHLQTVLGLYSLHRPKSRDVSKPRDITILISACNLTDVSTAVPIRLSNFKEIGKC